jgi:hypothetical protein
MALFLKGMKYESFTLILFKFFLILVVMYRLKYKRNIFGDLNLLL